MSSSEDGDEPPEIISSKAPPRIVERETPPNSDTVIDQEVREHDVDRATETQNVKPPRKISPQQPKKLPHNPFASRPSLLRNVSH
jgi:hypothetical protein